jgi:hypothetical protein
MPSKKPILCVDFDGVIHSYTSGWKGANIVSDPPVPGALRWLDKAAEWFEVNIYSSRTREPGGIAAMKQWLEHHAHDEFGNADSAMRFVDTMYFPMDKPPAFLTIDDRAICFEGHWSDLDPTELLDFKPWNQR